MTPNDWRVMSVGEFIKSANSGYSAIGIDRPANPEAGEVAVLTLTSIVDGRFRPEKHKTVVGSEVSKLKLSVKSGCILISRSNTPDLVGAAAYVFEHYPNHFLPDLIWQLEPATEYSVSMLWFCYFLQSPYGRAAIKKIAAGSNTSMVKIGKTSFFNILVPVPTFVEQRKIAAILCTWDEAITAAEHLVVALRMRKKALMQRLLTGEVRLPGFNEKWENTHLGDVFIERRESGRLDLPLLSITNSQGVVPRDKIEHRDTSAEDKSKYLRICEGDIGYNTMRMWQGVSAVSKLEGIVSPAYTICTPTKYIDADFMGYMFKFPPMIHLFWRYSQGLVDDTLSLKFNVFAKIPVMLPHINEQKQIAAILRLSDEQIESQEKEVGLLRLQKRGLMQKLLPGEVRVTVDE